jgi:predicted nucleotidyltransferase
MSANVNQGLQRDDPATRREQEVRQMLEASLRIAAAHLKGHRVVLFGSRARGNSKPRSDFDLGVIGDTPLPLEDFYAVEDLLESLPTLYRFDWVDLARTSKRFRDAALSSMEVIYEP